MAINIKVLHYIIRGYRSKGGIARNRSGIDKRIRLIEEEHPDIENIEVNECTLDNLENGVLNVDSFKDYSLSEERKVQRIINYKKLERKYFKKECYPNLLSWSEKEQIRFLYNSDSKTWSPDRLSQSFPATADIIKKLIKSQWKPMSSDRIISHDNSVCENWKAIENGLVKLPVFLEAHIKKFISRKKVATLMNNHDIKADNSLEEVHSSNNTSTEFLNIIKTYKGKDCVHNLTRNSNCPDDVKSKPSHTDETYVLNQQDKLPLKHKYYTLPQLKKELMLDLPRDGVNKISGCEPNNVAKELESKVNLEFIHSKYNTSQTIDNQCAKGHPITNIEQPEIPLKIRIPKENMAKSNTHVYRVKDCYYDCQGEFLYKVPGMT